jgi:Transmembrane secretion effector
VTIARTVAPGREIEFEDWSAQRGGGGRWELFRNGNDPTRFVESYLVGTWAEHLRRHENRLTGAMAGSRIRRTAMRSEPEVAHLFPPPAGEADVT